MSISSATRRNKPQPTRIYYPGDDLWQINRELLTVLSGPRSVLLELAHPLVAAGVAQHSKFSTRPLARLRHTLQTMIRFSFGGVDLVGSASQHMVKCHARVQGRLSENAGQYAVGDRYQANNPELRLWVWATLVDGVFVSYDAFIRPLTAPEKERYYGASLKMLPYMGVPEQVVPPTLADFNAYVEHVINDVLHVTDEAREIAAALFAPNLIGRAFWWASHPGLGLTPEHIIEGFSLTWNPHKQASAERVAHWIRRYRQVAPAPLRVWPQALWVEVASELGLLTLA